MKALNRHFPRAALLAASLAASPGSFAQASTMPAKPESQPPANQAVQPEVDRTTAAAVLEKRRQLIDEAQDAIAETEKALQALREKNSRAAMASLALATGRLELILARSPRLALAPVRTDVVTHDLLAKGDTVKAVLKEAREQLRNGHVQTARGLLAGLASEVELRTLNIPLDTYPAAIKAVTPLIDAGKSDEAISRLQALLTTLVVTTEAIPLPRLRAEEQIKAAQALAQKKGRSKEENAQLAAYLQGAREQLDMATLLGYGDKKDYQPMYQQLATLEKNTSDGSTGLGWFDKLKRQIAQLR